VLSGNRNFEGRIHPSVRDAYLASPALVVAYAIAGSMKLDIDNEAIGVGHDGRPVFLRDVWPADDEIDTAVARFVGERHFSGGYDPAPEMVPLARRRPDTPRFAWGEDSTYIRRPPYWSAAFGSMPALTGMRALAILGDNITTDHISPAGAIATESPAGRFLIEHGVGTADFNSYGTRRGNHEILTRATFANIRLKNEMLPGVEGPYTKLQPDGAKLTIFDAAQAYRERGVPLVVVAGRNYGCGSSRDWAAKGPRLLGVSAIVAESFERIHRANLAGMGVLPLELDAGTTRTTLGLDGSETFDVLGVDETLAPRSRLTLRVTRSDGSTVDVPVTCRLDTNEEIAYFRAGGLLPMMLDRLSALNV